MAMGACPGQIPMPCVPPALMVTATMVRACRYIHSLFLLNLAAKCEQIVPKCILISVTTIATERRVQ